MPITTATNKKTGETVAWVGNSWQPVTKSATGPGGEQAYLVSGRWVYDSDVDGPKTTAPAEPEQPAKPPEEGGFISGAKDILSGVTAGAGKIPLTFAKGVTDLASLATAGKLGADTSEFLAGTMESVDDYWHTENVKQQSAEFDALLKDEAASGGDVVVDMLSKPALLINEGLSALGSMVLPVGGAVAVGARAAAKAAQLGLGAAERAAMVGRATALATAGATAAQNAADTFVTLKDQPLEDRYLGAGVAGAVSLLVGKITAGGAEGAVAKRLLKDLQKGSTDLGPVMKFLKGTATTAVAAGKEGLQEAGEEAGAIAGETVGGEPVSLGEAEKRTALAALLGGVVGGGVNLIPGGTAAPEGAPQTPLPTEEELAAQATEVPAAPAGPTLTPEQASAVEARVAAAREFGLDTEIAREAALRDLGITTAPTIEEAPSAPQEAQPAEVAGKPVGVGTGVSPTVPVPPTTRAPTGLPQAPQRSGVVRAGETAGEDSGATSTEPTSLKPKRIKYDQYAEMMATLNPQQQYASVVERVRAGTLAPKVTDIQKKTPGLTRKDAQDIMVRLEANGIVTPVGEDGKRTVIPTAAPTQKVSAMVSHPAQKNINVEGVERPVTDSEGRPIHPTQEGVRNFWRWFGDSEAVVAVNADTGQPVRSSKEPRRVLPQVTYHTTRNNFGAFEVGRKTINSGTFGDWETSRAAVFVTPDISASQAYGTQGGDFVEGANVMPLYVKIEKPLDLTYGVSEQDAQQLIDAGMPERFVYNTLGNWAMFDGAEGRDTVKIIKRAGYDSVIFNDENPDTGESFVSYAVFNPNQIKSAIGNTGAFDATKEDIRAQQGTSDVDKRGKELFPYLKDFDSAVGAIVKYAGDKGQQAIAMRVKSRVAQLKKYGFEFSLKVTEEGYRLSSGASGQSVITFAGMGETTKIEVTLNHPSNENRSGTNWETVAHELVHAVTQAQIHYAPEGSAAKKLISLRNDIVEYFNKKVRNKEPLTPFEDRIYNGINAVQNTDELLAWGLTSKDMQEWLNSIPSKKGTFLSRLFDVVASALGFTRTDTALAELLEVADTILTEDFSPYKAEANRVGASFGRQENKTSIPSWALKLARGNPVVWHADDAALYENTARNGNKYLYLAIAPDTYFDNAPVEDLSPTGPASRSLRPGRLKEIQQIAKDLQKGKTSSQISQPTGTPPPAGGPTVRQGLGTVAQTPAQAQAQAQTQAQAAAQAPTTQTMVDYAIDSFDKSESIETLRESVSLGNRIRKSADMEAAVTTIAEAGDYYVRDALVKVMPTSLIIDIATQAKGSDPTQPPPLGELRRTEELVDRMNGARMRMLEGGAKLVADLTKLTKNNLEAFNKATLVSTVSQVDLRTNPTDPRMQALYARLGTDGQRAYDKFFNYYSAVADNVYTTLTSFVQSLNATPAERNKLLQRITEVLGPANRIHPYAPLSRDQEGEFWLGTGQAPGRSFITFSDVGERDAVAKQMAADRGTTVEALLASGDFTMGNDLHHLRRAMLESPNSLLQQIFSMIDNTGVSSSEDLKDAVFQMWIQIQPERSLAKGFGQRQQFPPAGYTTDVISTLNHSVRKFATQVPRLKYGSQIRQSLEQARAAIKGQPQLTPYVKEVEKRANLLLNPQRDTWFDTAVTLFNSSTFAYYMSLSTAALQAFGAYQTGAAQLLKHHSFADTTKELLRLAPIWKSMGNYSGPVDTWKMPTITDSAAVQDSPNDTPEERARKAEDRALIEGMRDRGVVEATAARDLFNFADMPTTQSDSAYQKAKNATDFIVGGVIHHTERLSREAIYLASARLWRNKMLTAFRKSPAYKKAADKTAAEHAYINSKIDYIAGKAAKDVRDSLFDYSKFGKPPIMQGPIGRLATQFQTYGLNLLVFMGRNIRGMVAPMGEETRFGCFKAFTGTMVNTAVLSGTTGLFGAPFILAAAAAFWDSEDEDKPATLRNLDPMTYYKNVWLPELIGNVTLFGKDISKLLVDVADTGLLNAATGVDMASRTSAADIGTPPDVREQRAPRDAAMEYMLKLGGPTLSMIISRIEGMSLIMDGEIYKGAEKMLPAWLRNPAQAVRYGVEGETTQDGKIVMKPSEFTKMNLALKATGFNPVTLADIKNQNFAAKKVEQTILNEKTAILDKLETAWRKQDADSYRKYLERMQEYNYRYALTYPKYIITPEQIRDRIEKRAKARVTATRGFNLNEENIIVAPQIIGPSRRALMETGGE